MDQKKIWSAGQGKETENVLYKEAGIRMTTGFSAATLKARRQ